MPTTKVWTRPHVPIYPNNYSYGSSLYRGAVDSTYRKHGIAPPGPIVPIPPEPRVVDLSPASYRLRLRLDRELAQEQRAAVAQASLESSSTKFRSYQRQQQRSVTVRRVKSNENLSAHEGFVSGSTVGVDEEGVKRFGLKNRRHVHSLHEAHLRFMEDREDEKVLQEQELEDDEFRRSRVRELFRKETAAHQSGHPSVQDGVSVVMSEDPLPDHPIDSLEDQCKQFQLEVEQLNIRLAEAEAKLKTEVARIKKKLQIQITELEMSLDAANKQNIDLQKIIKKQALQITELQAHYDEIHRQLQQAVDQLNVSQRRCQGLQAELDEQRVSLETALRSKRVAEQSLEEATVRINELNTINVNIASAKSKLESELSALQADYDELHKELRVVDERYNRTSIELKSTKDLLVEEQERYIKIESIKKSLDVEVRNLQVRLEEVEANALAGGKRVIAKLESRIRDIEIEFEEEKRRHAETQKVLRKKDHRVKELILQTEEDHKAISALNDAVEKAAEKVKTYKRMVNEQEGMSQQNLNRVRRFQRELEAAEDRADAAESNLSLIRAKHRSWVTTSTVPGGTRQVFVSEETTTSQY